MNIFDIDIKDKNNCYYLFYNKDDEHIINYLTQASNKYKTNNILNKSFLNSKLTIKQNMRIIFEIYEINILEFLKEIRISPTNNILNLTKNEMPLEVWQLFSFLIFSKLSDKKIIFTSFFVNLEASVINESNYSNFLEAARKVVESHKIIYISQTPDFVKLLFFDRYYLLNKKGNIEFYNEAESFKKAAKIYEF